jgi:hypothetical protein
VCTVEAAMVSTGAEASKVERSHPDIVNNNKTLQIIAAAPLNLYGAIVLSLFSRPLIWFR